MPDLLPPPSSEGLVTSSPGLPLPPISHLVTGWSHAAYRGRVVGFLAGAPTCHAGQSLT